MIGKDKLVGDNLKLLRREVTNLMALSHPNVLRLHEVYEDNLFFYLVLELIQVRVHVMLECLLCVCVRA